MVTQRITSTDEAADLISSGGLVAFPTETVFGLGVDATNAEAVDRLFVAKGRPSDNPLIVHLSDVSRWNLAATELTDSARLILEAFAPGPITVVLPKRESICPSVTAGLNTVGIRIPNHQSARRILQKVDRPVAAPSANRSGRPSGTTWRAVLEDLEGRIDAVYCEDSTRVGLESTVVDCTGQSPVVLRPGAITFEQLRSVTPDIRQINTDQLTVQATSEAGRALNSPGIAHPHYQPRAKVKLVVVPEPKCFVSDGSVAYCGMQEIEEAEMLSLLAVYSSVDEYAANFYEFLREADRQAIETVVVQLAPNEGIGQALRDRQRRSATD